MNRNKPILPRRPLPSVLSRCGPRPWQRTIMIIISSRISSPVSVVTRWGMIIGTITISAPPAGKNGRGQQSEQQNRHDSQSTSHNGLPPRLIWPCNCCTPNTAPDGSASIATSSSRSGSSPTNTFPPSFSAFSTIASISFTPT